MRLIQHLLGISCAVTLLLCQSTPAFSQEKPDMPAKEKAAADLPIQQVVMFSSGVAYFEHGGEVEGNAQVEMKFNVEDVNDLLKSMVLRDLDGGKISTVSFGSKDPITRTLQTFSIDLTNNPTMGDLLSQIRGEKIILDAPTKVQGIILGVETRRINVEDTAVEKQFLNLLTEAGLRSINLDKVGRIQLADKKLDSELRQALMVLAAGHSTDKKAVTLNFLGDGARQVRVGYIQESPVWKTSYRLVLGDDEKPLLQGLAIVENTTEDDWKEVDLTLVSGRPISFVMDLYQPLYVNRPVVQPELYASVTPRIYDQSLSGADADFARANLNFDKSKSDSYANAVNGRPSSGAFGAEMQEQARRQVEVDGLKQLSESLQVASQGGDVGELFRYQIATPVSLERGRSAMLPIVNDSVEAEKVSIYNANVHAKHPLNGLRLTNTTDLHLMQGPVTVFDGGAYAGDSRIADLQPKTERLMSYAMDLDVEVAPESKSNPNKLVKVIIDKGTLQVSTKYTRQTDYIVKNSGKAEKKVLIEYPLDSSWSLVTPKEPEEKTRDMYRFAVNAAPGKPATITVKEEKTTRSDTYLNNLADSTIQYYISNEGDVISEEVKTALAEVIKRKLEINQVVNARNEFNRQIEVVSKEQNRIRQNMDQLPRDSELYRRYVTKFTTQEDEVETLRDKVTKSIEEEQKLKDSLSKYLAGLKVS
jgi:hypothetical protein